MPLPKQLPRSRSAKAREKEQRILANRYKIQKRLGSGNFGTAWLSIDIKCKEEKDTLKVIKELPVGDLQPDETIDAMHEASLLRGLDHPGIVKFFDSFVDGEFFCIVTEFAEGGDLDQKIQEHRKKKKSIPEPQVIEWTIQLLLSVHYMHERKILHRDLKTRNIFLRNNMIKIGDFGISRILMGTTDMASTFVGTPYYMSPEVLKHEGYNSKSDVWSIGCILYELCQLEHAFEGQSLMGVMYKIVEGNLPDWPSKYSKDLKKVFEGILVKEPTERPSAGEVLKFPFIANQMELIKNTMVDKHNTKENKDVLNKESQEIYKALKEHKVLSDLRKESEEKMLKNMSPRERMRLRKQKKADEAAKRMKAAALQQLVDNKIKYNEIKSHQNPYEVETTLVPKKDDKVMIREMTDLAFGEGRPKTAPVKTLIIEDSESDELDEEQDEEAEELSSEEELPTVVEKKAAPPPKVLTSYNQKKMLSQSLDPRHLQPQTRPEFGTFQSDDRPITPMRNLMVYDREHSSLDFKDGVPDKPDLANTYYSQFESEFDSAAEVSEEEGDMEATIVPLGDGAAQEEVEDLINCMQNALDKSDTIKSTTLTDDPTAGAFGPGVRTTKIKNLRSDCEKKLGKAEFDKAYEFLKAARFGDDQGTPTKDENEIMKGLSKIVKYPNDCFLVDQLLFLEEQNKFC